MMIEMIFNLQSGPDRQPSLQSLLLDQDKELTADLLDS